MKKYLLLIMICLLTLCGCGKIPTLQNGEEAVIKFAKDKGEEKLISAEELYEELKNNYGLEATLSLIDTYIFEHEFEDYVETAKGNAQSFMDTLLESYDDSKDKLLQAIVDNTNYSTIEAYQNYLYNSYMQSHAIEEYAKTLVTDKEIETYYNDEAKEDVEVYHILITPDVTDNMTTTDREAKEKEAKEKAENLLKEIKGSDDLLATFKKLAKENSEDENTKDKDGNLGYINYGDLDSNYDELLDAVYKIKDGELGKEVVTTELGYHIIYRNASKEKETLEKLKDEILETLANRKISNTKTIQYDTYKYYRELYNLEIIDSELNKQYGIYMNSMLNNLTSNTETE